jgi:2-isopropylmalate synthase
MEKKKIQIYDTTLRDGAQAGGISFSVEDKLAVAKRLDKLGFDYIEGGWPGSNPKDIEFFEKAAKLDLKHAKLAAFGSTCRKDKKPEEDDNLRLLLEAKTPAITIFGKSSVLHVKDALNTTPENNLKMISGSIKYLKNNSDAEMIYDAEHFFDGYKLDKDYAMKTLMSAKDVGADFIVLCDTNGGTDFYEVQEIVRHVKKALGDARLGIHAHNDIEYGTANTYAAVVEGAEMVQGTVNGFGERVGNANLITIIPNLSRKNFNTNGNISLKELKPLSRYVYELANLPLNERQAYVGDYAFAHKGGIHVSAVLKNSKLYEHYDPSNVGNKRQFLISELSGTSSVEALGKGISRKDNLAKDVVSEIKAKEHKGFSYEAAEGSLDLLLRKQKGEETKIFDLVEYKVEIVKKGDEDPISKAIVKIRVNGDEVSKIGEGDGPVNALDTALRAALTSKFPELKQLKLKDFKVRIIPEQKGTAAKVRVLIESQKNEKMFGTVGVHENIIEASWQALIESFAYAHLNKEKIH